MALYLDRKWATMLNFEWISDRINPKPKPAKEEITVIWESLPPNNTSIIRAKVALSSWVPRQILSADIRNDHVFISRKRRKIVSHSFLKHLTEEAGFSLKIV